MPGNACGEGHPSLDPTEEVDDEQDQDDDDEDSNDGQLSSFLGFRLLGEKIQAEQAGGDDLTSVY
jgi:hypothetical protein